MGHWIHMRCWFAVLWIILAMILTSGCRFRLILSPVQSQDANFNVELVSWHCDACRMWQISHEILGTGSGWVTAMITYNNLQRQWWVAFKHARGIVGTTPPPWFFFVGIDSDSPLRPICEYVDAAPSLCWQFFFRHLARGHRDKYAPEHSHGT